MSSQNLSRRLDKKIVHSFHIIRKPVSIISWSVVIIGLELERYEISKDKLEGMERTANDGGSLLWPKIYDLDANR